jgi:hypothetical protein
MSTRPPLSFFREVEKKELEFHTIYRVQTMVFMPFQVLRTCTTYYVHVLSTWYQAITHFLVISSVTLSLQTFIHFKNRSDHKRHIQSVKASLERDTSDMDWAITEGTYVHVHSTWYHVLSRNAKC